MLLVKETWYLQFDVDLRDEVVYVAVHFCGTFIDLLYTTHRLNVHEAVSIELKRRQQKSTFAKAKINFFKLLNW